MNSVSTSYLNRAEIWLFLSTLLYFMMNGAQLFETFVIVPKWTAAPPASFQLFEGPHGLDFKTFWIVAHSIHEVTFIMAIAFCWKLGIRNWLLVLFAVHFAVRVWTLVYFAPQIMDFQRIAQSGEAGVELIRRADLWRQLNYLRVGIFVAVSLGMIPLCMRLLQIKGN